MKYQQDDLIGDQE